MFIDENRLMDKQDNMDNLEEIIDRQINRLHKLDGTTVLIKGKQNIKDELQTIYEKMLLLSCDIEEMRETLKRMNQQNSCFRETLAVIEALDKRILHQEKNVPQELIHDATMLSPNMSECPVNSTRKLMPQNMPSSIRSARKIEKQEMVKDCKRTLFSEPEVCPMIPFITAEEFSKIPKYMIGRQSLETINNLISAINQTLIAKYTILSLGKVAAQKKGEINLYLQYKKQEFDIREETRYLYFFTAEDYYRQTKTKIDKTKLNLMTALRHCKRLRECRIKNELRYVITPY